MQLIGFKNQKIVNLDNVSNIYVDEQGKKVIFNMNYSVKIFGSKNSINSYDKINKVTPDYVYWSFDSMQEFMKIVDLIINKTKNWIQPEEPGQRILNPDFIASITFDEDKNRVIFNLNYNITHPKDDNKLTSDFVFYDFVSKDSFNAFFNKIKTNVTYL